MHSTNFFFFSRESHPETCAKADKGRWAARFSGRVIWSGEPCLQEIEDNQSSAPDDPLPELFSPGEWRALTSKLRLSPRQAQVARLICLGLSKEQMAARLRVSEPTARLHVKELFLKLRINDRIGVPVRLVVAGRTLRIESDDRDEPS